MNKSKKNLLFFFFFLINLFLFFGIWFALLNFKFDVFLLIVFWLLNSILLHNFFNLTHLASHNQINSNRNINQFIGIISALLSGVTLPSFKNTHLLHHIFVGDQKKDPDYFITNSGGIFSIPFKIWYHDFFYLKNKLWKKDKSLKIYFLTRGAQILIIFLLLFSGKIFYFISFWLLNNLFIGLLNGLYLFYIPHYKLEIEKNKQDFLFKNIFFLTLKISRFYHELHHLQIQNISAYFPISNYLIIKLKKIFSLN